LSSSVKSAETWGFWRLSLRAQRKKFISTDERCIGSTFGAPTTARGSADSDFKVLPLQHPDTSTRGKPEKPDKSAQTIKDEHKDTLSILLK